MIDLQRIDRLISDYDRIKHLLAERRQRGYSTGWRHGMHVGRYTPLGRTPEYLESYRVGYEHGREDQNS